MKINDCFTSKTSYLNIFIKILKECEIIDYRQEGRTRYCSIRPKTLIPAYMWIEQYQKLWEDKLDSFDQYLSKLQSERKIEPNE